ncbi:mechanosensitive ion channel [Rhodopirellula sp.]|nr:mechanosensitive ion channel [Rhodopirellula sp.]
MSCNLHTHRTQLYLSILTAIAFNPVTMDFGTCQTVSPAATVPNKNAATPTEKDATPAQASAPVAAATTVDPNVTNAHLKLFVKPLTLEELDIEAKGWQNLLKQNVQKITSIHIRIEQLTDQIEASENGQTTAILTPAPPTPKAADPANTPAAQATNLETDPDPTNQTKTQETTGQAATPASPTLQSPSALTPASPVVSKPETAVDTARAKTNVPNATTIESLTELKTQLSNQLTDLTLQKTDISQKFEIVLNSLDLKGGDTASYRKYNNALTGVALEVTSTSGMWRMFTSWITAEQGGKRWALNILRFVITLLVSYFGASILANFVRRAASRVKGVSQLLVNFLSSFTKQISMVIGFIIGLAALEIDITPLIAAVGAAGFVVAFALQGTLSNFASGLLILAYRPFDVGDVIESAGVSGNVDSVSLFSTHVRTFDNKLMIIPNNDIWGGTITNATASTTRRVDLIFGIGYADDINQAKSILKNAVENHPLILKDPAANIRVNELGDSSVNLICRPWTRTENYWSVYWDLMHTVKQEFDSAGVSIPFPQRDVHIYHQTPPTPDA